MLKGYSAKNGNPSKKNALVNGYYARDVLLPWESREDFEKLFADLREEFQPDGRMEEESVFDLAYLRWQKRRIQEMWHAAAYDDPFVIRLMQLGKKSWSGIRDHLRTQAKVAHEGAKSLSGMMAELTVEAIALSEKLMKEGLEKSKIDNIRHQIEAIVKVMTDLLVPLMQLLENGPSAEKTLHNVYSPEHLEPIIRLEASIDARIDKTLARLANLKEYKRLPASYQTPLQIPARQTFDLQDMGSQLKGEDKIKRNL